MGQPQSAICLKNLTDIKPCQWVPHRLKQPFPVGLYIYGQAAAEFLAELVKPIAIASTKIPASLRLARKKHFLAHFGGLSFVTLSIVQKSFDQEWHDGGVIRLHAFGGLLIVIFIHLAPRDCLARRTRGKRPVGHRSSNNLDVEMIAAHM